MKLSKMLFAPLSAAIVMTVGVIGMATPNVAEASGFLYSNAALNRFCRGAQKIIARTPLRSDNVVYDDLGTPGVPFPPPGIPATGFIGSDALPYDGAEELPLTTTQYVGFGTDASGDEYAQTVMCKMKSWDALDFYFPGKASEGSNCSSINQVTTGLVFLSMLFRGEFPVITDIEFDDWDTFTGQQWTDSSPAPSAYISTTDGKLHLVGKRLYVERTNPSPFVGAPKKGVDYCQVIAPEYLRNILRGDITAPTCDDFPVYSPPVGGPPQGPLPWACANP